MRNLDSVVKVLVALVCLVVLVPIVAGFCFEVTMFVLVCIGEFSSGLSSWASHNYLTFVLGAAAVVAVFVYRARRRAVKVRP